MQIIYQRNMMIFNSYDCCCATSPMVRSPWNFACLLRVISHMSESFKFSFRIYRLLGLFVHAPFLNEPIISNQRTKFYIFLIIIDLESPENITTVVWSRLSEKPETTVVCKSRFLTYLWIINERFDWQQWFLRQSCSAWGDLSNDIHIVWMCETPRDYRAIKLVSAN